MPREMFGQRTSAFYTPMQDSSAHAQTTMIGYFPSNSLRSNDIKYTTQSDRRRLGSVTLARSRVRFRAGYEFVSCRRNGDQRLPAGPIATSYIHTYIHIYIYTLAQISTPRCTIHCLASRSAINPNIFLGHQEVSLF